MRHNAKLQAVAIMLPMLLAGWLLTHFASAPPSHAKASAHSSKVNQIMADTITVSGAGSSQFNQDYNESSGPDNYSSSDTFETLFYNTNAANGPVNSWIITDVVGNPPAYYAAGTLLAGPSGLTYSIGAAGTSPAPTVSGGDARIEAGTSGSVLVIVQGSGGGGTFVIKDGSGATVASGNINTNVSGWEVSDAVGVSGVYHATVTVPSGAAQENYALDLQAGGSAGHYKGSFDVIPGASASPKSISGIKQFPAATNVDQLKISAVSPHAPQLALQHGSTFGTWTSVTGLPAPSLDASIANLWHFSVPLSPAVSDKMFMATLTSAAGTSDAVRATDYRAYYHGAEIGGPVPATPTGLSGVAGSAQATLSWDASSDISVLGYTMTQDGTPISASGATLSGGRYTLVVTGLTNGTAYAFRVADYNANGSSPYSAPVSVTPGSTASEITVSITQPTDFGIAYQGILNIQAKADNGVGGVAKVELYVAGALVSTLAAPTTAPDYYDLPWDTRPSANGDYVVMVKAYDRASTPNTATATATVTVDNPSVLTTSYWYSAAQTPRPGDAIRELLATCDVVPTDDPRELRQIVMGYRMGATTGGFEANYTTIPLNQQQAIAGSDDTYSIAVRMASRYEVSQFSFAADVKKIVGFGAGAVIWDSSNKLWLFDGISTPTLMLDASTIMTSGETLNDVCASGSRLALAIAGGSSPVTNRIYEYDPAATDESYSLYVLPSAPNALGLGTDGTLYIGTEAGLVHTLSPSGALAKLVGKTTPLPNAVTGIIAAPLALTNATPGIALILSDGSVWDIDGTEATYGARKILNPNGTTETAAYCGSVIAGGAKYIGTGAGGDLLELGGTYSTYTTVFTAPAAVIASAAFENTLFFAVSSDPRLWALTLAPSANTLPYSPVIDALGGGVAGITALYAIGDNLFLGTTGGANNLWQYQSPPQDANAVYGAAIMHPGAEVTQFA